MVRVWRRNAPLGSARQQSHFMMSAKGTADKGWVRGVRALRRPLLLGLLIKPLSFSCLLVSVQKSRKGRDFINTLYVTFLDVFVLLTNLKSSPSCNSYTDFLWQWFGASYTYQAALTQAETGMVTVLSSTSALFTLFLSALFPSSQGDRFTLSKLVAVCISICGLVSGSASLARTRNVAIKQGQRIPVWRSRIEGL